MSRKCSVDLFSIVLGPLMIDMGWPCWLRWKALSLALKHSVSIWELIACELSWPQLLLLLSELFVYKYCSQFFGKNWPARCSTSRRIVSWSCTPYSHSSWTTDSILFCSILIMPGLTCARSDSATWVTCCEWRDTLLFRSCSTEWSVVFQMVVSHVPMWIWVFSRVFGMHVW